MNENSIYSDIAQRTDGTFMLGVVGPVRTGKSTFIKRFMETLVIPELENTYARERARDELPQSGSGRTIMTAEPKFIPEDAVTINIDGAEMSVRLIDCVGYMVDGAAGQYENGSERLVTTPWFDHEVTMTEAAEKGTRKVIEEHSNIGLVITTDGTICDIPREDYIEPETRVITELKEIGKPFIVLLNSADPMSDYARQLADEIAGKYDVACIPVDCRYLGREDFSEILSLVMHEFPLKAIGFELPDWVEALPDDCAKLKDIYSALLEASNDARSIRDVDNCADRLCACESIDNAHCVRTRLGTGTSILRVNLPKSIYYETLSETSGFEISSDRELMEILCKVNVIYSDYNRIRDALEQVRTTGYGIVMPDSDEMQLDEPEIVRQGGKYSVKLKARAPAIHMLATNVEAEVSPAIAGENASEEIVGLLMQSYEGDVSRIWQSNIFGKSLYEIAQESLDAKITSLPNDARSKLQDALQKIINEGCGGLICILL